MSTADLLLRCLQSYDHLWKGELTRTQFAILSYLHLNGKSSQRIMRDALSFDRSTLSDTLRRLESQKYLNRHRDENDARNVIIVISHAGKYALNKTKRGAQETENSFLSHLTGAEETQLTAILKKLCLSI